jgi:hypothetical protein
MAGPHCEIAEGWIELRTLKELLKEQMEDLERSYEQGKCNIKGGKIVELEPSSPVLNSPLTREIKLDPTAVQHEAELSSLFNSPTTS